jgi:hypothetical protein
MKPYAGEELSSSRQQHEPSVSTDKSSSLLLALHTWGSSQPHNLWPAVQGSCVIKVLHQLSIGVVR